MHGNFYNINSCTGWSKNKHVFKLIRIIEASQFLLCYSQLIYLIILQLLITILFKHDKKRNYSVIIIKEISCHVLNRQLFDLKVLISHTSDILQDEFNFNESQAVLELDFCWSRLIHRSFFFFVSQSVFLWQEQTFSKDRHCVTATNREHRHHNNLITTGKACDHEIYSKRVRLPTQNRTSPTSLHEIYSKIIDHKACNSNQEKQDSDKYKCWKQHFRINAW